MQTFMPCDNYYDSMNCIDPKRLGNQIWREAKTLASGGWPNHPASKMWIGHLGALCDYAIAGLEVLARRPKSLGYGSGKVYPTHLGWFRDLRSQQDNREPPSWMGDEEVHSSHRAALLRKGIEDATYNLWVSHFKPDLGVPAKKSQWLPVHYEKIWQAIDKPDPSATYYGQFQWDEEPAEPDEKGSLPYVWPVPEMIGK